MRIDNQQQQNKGVMDLMPQTGAVEEKNGIQMFADAVKTESSKKSAGTTSFQAKEVTYLNPAKEEKKTVIDEIEQSGSMDAGERKAQMAVLAETTSPEDYEKMQEDGFSLDDTTSNKIVTVTDKIKAQLAKAGVDISKFGDDLDLEQLAQITGSPELAVQIANSLREADLPLADDNFKQIAETVNMADSLSALDDGAVKYLIDNRLEPTVRNIYFAEHSASAGYISAEQQDISSFLPQVKNVIASAGLEVNDDTIATSKWTHRHRTDIALVEADDEISVSINIEGSVIVNGGKVPFRNFRIIQPVGDIFIGIHLPAHLGFDVFTDRSDIVRSLFKKIF